MYIYGLDLSMLNTGVTIIDEETFETVYIGSIGTKGKQFQKLSDDVTFSVRLEHHYKEINKLIKKYPPSVAVIERGFSRFNNATQVVFRVHGVYNLAFSKVPNVYYPPKKIKEVIYKGTADKSELADALKAKFDVSFKNEDESDSFAVAITYLIENGMEWEKPKAYTKKDIKKLKTGKTNAKSKNKTNLDRAKKARKSANVEVDVMVQFEELESEK